MIFGEPEVTTGAAGDLQQITGLAKQVIKSPSICFQLLTFKLQLTLSVSILETYKTQNHHYPKTHKVNFKILEIFSYLEQKWF